MGSACMTDLRELRERLRIDTTASAERTMLLTLTTTHRPATDLGHLLRKEPLRRVHEAVFGVLALESEPVDPRL